jgi:hypothetical protein
MARRKKPARVPATIPISTPIITHTTEPPTGDEQYLRAEEVFAALLEDLDVVSLEQLRIASDDALAWRLQIIEEYIHVYSTLVDFLGEQATWIEQRLNDKPKGRRS